MQALGEYVVSVSAAAFVCAIAGSLMPKGPAKELLKLVGGLFLAFTVIRPVSQLELPQLSEITDQIRMEGEAAGSLGREMAEDATADSIIRQLEAYILDKAKTMGLAVTVHLTLQEQTLLPERIELTGDASPILRRRLTEQLSQELGIAVEEIRWTGTE